METRKKTEISVFPKNGVFWPLTPPFVPYNTSSLHLLLLLLLASNLGKYYIYKCDNHGASYHRKKTETVKSNSRTPTGYSKAAITYRLCDRMSSLFWIARSLITSAFCTRSVFLWNVSKKSVRTGPAGRPRAKPHRKISILAPFFEVQKMDISGPYSKQYRGYACSSGRLLVPAHLRRPVLLVIIII